MQLMNLLKNRDTLAGDFWGGLAAMLVALPAAIAFGVTVYAAIGPAYASFGALAGLVGATVIGLVASSLGGTDRLISTPCAPAAAVLSALAIEMVRSGTNPGLIVLLLVLTGILAGLVQLGLGLVGIGKLIKYIPYPVVSGYMSGVGLIIIGSQIPKFAGAPDGIRWMETLTTPSYWDWRPILIAIVTAIVMMNAHRVTKRVPGIIIGIGAGVVTYFLIAIYDNSLLTLSGNSLVIGELTVSGDGYLSSVVTRWMDLSHIGLAQVASVFGTALTLGVLLSIDTLKTCVILDQLTRSRHDSNRELIAQGIGNIAANAFGGMSGAGQMGATLVGLNSGSASRIAGMFEGIFALIAALLLSSLIAWIPVSTLAGILMVIGVRMIDRGPLKFIKSRATMLDFVVVITVILVAVTVSLIAASAVGVGLAMILFVREQISGTVIRNKMELLQTSSSWHRPEGQMAILQKMGKQAVIFELQGSLFFGNTYQLYTDLEHEIGTRQYVIIDMKRVQSIDVTALHLFNHIRDDIRERGAKLILSGILENHPNGRNLQELIGQSGLWKPESKTVRIFPDLDSAVAWVEDRLLGSAEGAPATETPMELQEMELFCKCRDETIHDLESCMEIRHYQAGETIYRHGDPGDELYWVRRGAVRLMATLPGGKQKPVASFGRGDFFGGLAFLDCLLRPNDAVAVSESELYVLTRPKFNQIAEGHKKLAFNLASAMARTLAMRLRRTELKLTTLQ